MYGLHALPPVLLALAAASCFWAVASASDEDMLAQAMASLPQLDSKPVPAATSGDLYKLMVAMANIPKPLGSDSSPSLIIRQEAPAKSLLTPECAQKLLDEHNNYRTRIARGLAGGGLKPAANMVLMEWDDRLAITAKEWACQCVAKPDSSGNSAVPGLTRVTQSLATGWLPDVTAFVAEWFDQRANWDPVSGSCRPNRCCGEFLRLASASSRYLGCALHDCQRASGFAVLLVCNYAGGGGDPAVATAVSPPYAPGPCCRACPASFDQCMLGLCATRGLCEAAAATGAACICTDAPCFDNPDCPSPQQQELASAACRTDSAVSQCPRLCNACGGLLADASYRPNKEARIVARVTATGHTASSPNT